MGGKLRQQKLLSDYAAILIIIHPSVRTLGLASGARRIQAILSQRKKTWGWERGGRRQAVAGPLSRCDIPMEQAGISLLPQAES